MVLEAVATPTDTATPTAPKPAAMAAVPATASIREISDALTVTDCPLTPAKAPSPSIAARVVPSITLIAPVPAPDTETPTIPPLTATEPATVIALISCASCAFTVTSPELAVTWLDRISADTIPAPATLFPDRSRPI